MDGILLLNKPILWTSHDAVDFIRRRLGQKSVGHAGTLDPLATGLLVLLLGKATKLSQELSVSDKEYAGSMTLGVSTDTQDMEGRVLAEKDFLGVERDEVESIFLSMLGAQQQIPPAFSAVKKKGKSLYAWARQGMAVQGDAREVTLSRFSLTEFSLPEIHFSLDCSKGTYVRTICNSVGEKLGCGATLSSLVRIRSGNFLLKDALSQKEVSELSFSDIEKRSVRNFDESLQRV